MGYKRCAARGCERKSVQRGWCLAHDARVQNHGSAMEHVPLTTEERFCSMPDCDEVHIAKGFCNMHYRRFLVHGDPLVVLRTGRKPKVGAS